VSSEDLISFINKFTGIRVAVVGDVYLDENTYGAMTGVSLEAPVPILEIHDRRYNPGAAGNVACNMAALGALPVMVGFIGADQNGVILRESLGTCGVGTTHLVVDEGRPTNTYGKLRAGAYHASSQEILRTDTPTPLPVSGATEDAIINAIGEVGPHVDAIAVVDQVSSVVTKKVLAAVVACAKKHDLITVGDSRDNAQAFKGFHVVAPNEREACAATKQTLEKIEKAGKALLKVCKNVLITRGPKGISAFSEDGAVEDVPAIASTAVDVTGAGDSVTATVTLALAAGASLHDSAAAATYAGAISVAQHGVVTVSQSELRRAILHPMAPTKLKSSQELVAIIGDLQREGKKAVWTNGCFDILHAGHVLYLQQARQAGDVLVVGMNSDSSVQRIKGAERPYVREEERAVVLAALECVDYITIFDDESTASLLEELKPQVYAKGGDYTVDTINQDERRIVDGFGGIIVLIPGMDNRSTTNLVSKIRNGAAPSEG
jgi:D-beta-D-heptose 7-phosphate kinase/D-beta-D-heptose 1-phosphate adenosyltransferase